MNFDALRHFHAGIWLGYFFRTSVGFRSFDPLRNHFVAVFAYENEKFREIGRVSLEDPDILFDNSVMNQEIDGRIWLEVNGGVGAHGNCLNVLRLDQGILYSDIAHCHSSAHFLRGWGTFLLAPDDPGVIEDIERAAAWAPDEPLYSESLVYLRVTTQAHEKKFNF